MYSRAAMKCADNLQNTDEPYTAMQQTLLDDILSKLLTTFAIF